MRKELFYNPFILIERLGIEFQRRRRLDKLKNTVASTLTHGHIDSLEFLEIISSHLPASCTIYDIGANIGTWTLLAKSIVPSATIHAFEPLAIHTRAFEKNTAQLESTFLHPVALGNKNTEMAMQLASHSDASSLMELTDEQKRHFNMWKTGESTVQVVKLDEYVVEKAIDLPDVIKLDIQGYEIEALKGGILCLRKACFVISEVSFIEFYRGQPLFFEVVQFMYEQGFHIHAFGMNTPLGKPLLQIDILFKKIG